MANKAHSGIHPFYRSFSLGLSAAGRKFGDVFCSAGFQTCCLADFQIRKRPDKGRSADWEVGDTAGLETCVTSSYLRPAALSSKHEQALDCHFPVSNFGIRNCFVIRASSLVILIV